MAITAPPAGGKAPVSETPDPKAAASGGGGTDRAGFDLGGSKEPGAGPETPPGGPTGSVPAGSDHLKPGAATGMSQGSAQATGGPAGGAKPGEATQATAGAVRPPQSTSADQTFTQGNPDDAA